MANEKQLIDANDVYSLFDINGFARMHLSDIDTISRVDAVEVVRCRSCKDYNWIPNCGRPMCTNLRGLTIAKPNDFCPYGQRKDDDGND